MSFTTMAERAVGRPRRGTRALRCCLLMVVLGTSGCLDGGGDGSPTPLWVDEDGLNGSGRDALEALTAAADEGLPTERYWTAELRSALEDSPPATVEAELSRSLSLLAEDLANGLVASTSWDPGWQVDSLDNAALPADPASGRAILEHVSSMRPTVAQYERLRGLLSALEDVRDSGGWGRVELGDDRVSEGERSPVVAQLRARLRASPSEEERRLAATRSEEAESFDADLSRAVELFQSRHDLEPDGALGPETAAALNVTAEERIAQVELALERWRWLPADLGHLAVVVNVAGRRIHVLEEGEEILSMKAVVGERDWRTALFQDEIEQLVVNPPWNIPDGIMSREILPRVLEEPEYLSRNDMEIVDVAYDSVLPLDSLVRREDREEREKSLGIDSVVVDPARADGEEGGGEGGNPPATETIAYGAWDYRIRQRPGAKNPLGRVKFLFPNDYDIYLHDTPADHLFDERLRTFSHGCIRVERPLELAHLLVERASRTTGPELDSLLATGKTHEVELDTHLPVYLVYQTVWVDENGVPSFFPDVYERDAEARAALAEAHRERAGRASNPGGPGDP